MPFLILIVGVVLVIAALRDTIGQLGTALATDVPGYMRWGSAVAGVAALGWIPGMARVARPLLALVIIVLVLRNYQAVISGFQHASQTTTGTAVTPSPAEAFAANPRAPVTVASITGGGGDNASTLQQATQLATQALKGTDPNAYLAQYGGNNSSGFGGGTQGGVQSGDSEHG